jgi:hypothetical protein
MLSRLRGWLFHLNVSGRISGSPFNIFRRRPFLIIVPASPPAVASGKAQFKDAAILRIENNISAMHARTGKSD